MNRESFRRLRVGADWLAGFAAALWVGAFGALYLRGGFDGADRALVLLGLMVPLVALWGGVVLVRSLRRAQRDLATLAASVDAMSADLRAQQAVRTLRESETALPAATPAMFSTRRSAAVDQPVLALGPAGQTDTGPPDPQDLIRALHFPEDADDADGFAALNRVLADHPTAVLIRNAQAVLTALAEMGIYMDDLHPDRARPEVWRAFASGARGGAVAGLGGLQDRASLRASSARMRQDPAFRTAAHRFLRDFDRCLRQTEPALADPDLVRLTETRSARAFIVLGQVTGVFGR